MGIGISTGNTCVEVDPFEGMVVVDATFDEDLTATSLPADYYIVNDAGDIFQVGDTWVAGTYKLYFAQGAPVVPTGYASNQPYINLVALSSIKDIGRLNIPNNIAYIGSLDATDNVFITDITCGSKFYKISSAETVNFTGCVSLTGEQSFAGEVGGIEWGEDKPNVTEFSWSEGGGLIDPTGHDLSALTGLETLSINTRFGGKSHNVPFSFAVGTPLGDVTLAYMISYLTEAAFMQTIVNIDGLNRSGAYTLNISSNNYPVLAGTPAGDAVVNLRNRGYTVALPTGSTA